MASRQQDVELVIKAKNEATKVLESLNRTLEDLTGNQGKVAKSADKTGDLVGQLGTEFKDLGNQLKGLAAIGKIAAELDRASTAVSKIDEEVKSAANNLGDLARQSQAATEKTTGLRARLEAETRTRDENNDSLREAKKELREVEAAIRKATTAQGRANEAIGKQVKPNPFSAANSASVFVQADLGASQAKQSQLNREIATYEANVKGARDAIKDITPAVTAASRQQDKLAAETEKAAEALSSQRVWLVESRTNLAAIRDISDQANAKLGSLAGTQDKVAAASARMGAQMAAAKARIDALATTKPAAATPKFEGVGTEQGRVDLKNYQQVRREYEETARAANELARQMRTAEQPTEELGNAFGRAVAAARIAKQEFIAQRDALARTREAAQGGFTAFAQLEARMRAAGAATGTLATNVNSAVAGQTRLAESARSTGSAMDGGARGTHGFRSALGGLYGESRQAMSIMQRLRGEVLSLVTAYVGLHAAVSQISGVVSAFQTMEAAQSRLGVVFDQDTAKVAQEISFLNAEASRLGISFETLADQYGKFAIAANGANFSAESTRKIFVALAEAGRVNKLSTEQMGRAFTALQQMITKGKISAEELQGQMGDALPGAFQLFADALGVTGAELSKLMKNGDALANESNMLRFADTLQDRFGPQLASSLEGVTAEIGKLQNEVFNAQLRVGEGGFIAELEIALRDLNQWFASRDGRDFFLSLGQALGTFVSVLRQVPQYFGLIQSAVLALIGARLGNTLLGINGQLRANILSMTVLTGRVSTLRAAVIVLTGAFSTLRNAMITIRGIAAGMLGMLGGIPGLIVTGILLGVTSWMSGVDKATSALDEHKRQLAEVSAAYMRAGNGVEGWAKTINNVTLAQAEGNLAQLTAQYQEHLAELMNQARGVREVARLLNSPLQGPGLRAARGDAFAEQTLQLDALLTRFEKGEITAKNFQTALDDLYRSTEDLDIKRATQSLLDMLNTAEDGETSVTDLSDAMDAQKLVIAALRGEVVDLGEDVTETNKAFSTEAVDAYKAALEELKGTIPELAVEMKRLQDLSKLDTAWQDVLSMGPPTKEAQDLYNRAVEAINLEAFSKEVKGSLMQASVGLLKTFEGYRSTAYNDPKTDANGNQVGPNIYRAGYGSNTITLADGTIKKITEGMSVNQTDALRDLVRRIGEFQDVVKRQVGSERFNAFSTEQQAALTSVAYNYSSLPDRILDAVKTGTAEEIAAAVRGLGGDNGGVNANRRNTEAQILGEGSTGLTQQRVDAEAELNQHVTDRVAVLKEEALARQESSRELEITKEIQRAENEAQKTGLALSQEQIAAIREATGARYDALHAAEAEKAKLEEIKASVAEIVGLDQQRSNLLKEMTLAQTQGDDDRLEQTKTQIGEINAKILELIPNALAMAQALGDEKMVATLQKVALNTDLVNQKVTAAATSVNFLGLNFNQMKTIGQSFASGVAGAFDKVAQAIANGEDATEALKNAFLQFAADFLRQIAQMIIQQAILNMMQSLMGGGGGGGGGGMFAGMFNHTGGLAGREGSNRNVPAAVFANAMRYHEGGVAGLKPNEVPTILERNEEVLTTDDPRHQFNGGGQQKAGDTKIINAFDTASFLSEALNTRVGEKAILNFVQANAGAIKGALG